MRMKQSSFVWGTILALIVLGIVAAFMQAADVATMEPPQEERAGSGR